MGTKCLNCGNETVNCFCSICGQKNSTHRFSMKHFFLHDFIHGVFHLDKGFLFTLKELYTRPGNSIREYIQGKRAKHFNYFTLMLLIYALSHFLAKIPEKSVYDIMIDNNISVGNYKVLKEYAKFIMLLYIPLYSLATFLFYYKSKLNYTEHVVMAMYYSSAILVFHVIPIIAPVVSTNLNFILTLRIIVGFTEYLYYFWFLYQFFSKFKFNKVELIIRTVLVVFIMSMITFAVGKVVGYIGLNYF